MTRRRVLAYGAALPAAVGAFPTITRAQDATPIAPVDVEWPFYGRDLTGGKATESGGISSGNVGELGPLWQVAVNGPVSSTPVIAGGVAYVGSYDGSLYAIEIQSGALLWSRSTGAAMIEPNLQIPLGIPGSAAVSNGVVFVGDSTATVHAVDAMTGESVWTMLVDDQPNACIWSSPVVSGDLVVVGVASVSKEIGARGSVVALNRASGAVVWQTYMVPEGADGAGVFAVPAIDETRGVLYVGTQNAYSPNPAPFGNPISVLALKLATGELVWAFNAVPDANEAPTDDIGFSASPNLFSAEIDGGQKDLVGVGQKSGDFYALDRETGTVVWKTTVSPAGFLGGMEGTSAYSNGIVAVPATNWPDFDGPASGLVSALDASSGSVLWTTTETAPAASPTAISSDVVLHAGLDGILHAFSLTDGTELLTLDLGASVSGGIAVADGVVVLGAATPQFASFIKLGDTIQGFAAGANAATPIASPVVPVEPETPEPSTPAASPVA